MNAIQILEAAKTLAAKHPTSNVYIYRGGRIDHGLYGGRGNPNGVVLYSAGVDTSKNEERVLSVIVNKLFGA